MVHGLLLVAGARADGSDSEASSVCGSELELAMAWGEGPIAPLRPEATTDEGAVSTRRLTDGKRSDSNCDGSSRVRTPQKRGSEALFARRQRQITLHPIRSARYLANPNELPLGARKQQRWFNDHHFGNRAASTRLEDLMEHMEINVEWRSNLQKLAEPQHEDVLMAFRQGRGVRENHASHARRNRRNDEWNDAEQMFTRVDRRARTLMLRSFNSFAPFIEAVEYVVLHFIQWREVPSELEVAAPLFRVLKHPIELMKASENDVRLILPLLDSAFHRLIIHSVCQFYGVRSRTEASCRLNTKIMVLKIPKESLTDELTQTSLCEFIYETRIVRRQVGAGLLGKPMDNSNALEVQSKSSECSEGYCLVEAPQT